VIVYASRWFEKFIAAFKETHPEITIEGEYFAGANQEYFQKIAVLFAGGNPGDLVWLSSLEGYYDYAARDYLNVMALMDVSHHLDEADHVMRLLWPYERASTLALVAKRTVSATSRMT
jgi:ABC-type glycerol-3-phosphate transport system substrate-binding protein